MSPRELFELSSLSVGFAFIYIQSLVVESEFGRCCILFCVRVSAGKRGSPRQHGGTAGESGVRE